MVVYLGRCGHTVNRKRAMRTMGRPGSHGTGSRHLQGAEHLQHKVYPYLLRGVAVLKPSSQLITPRRLVS